MDVVSIGPLPVSSLVWQPRPGAWVLTVIARATYLLRPGEAVLAPSQEPPSADDRTWGDDPARSLQKPRDLVPAKPLAEVMLVGSAHAPERRPVRSLVARLSVGEIDKSIEVVVDRFLGADGVVHDGPPFTQMPLAWERAAGGPGTVNPVGVARVARDAEGHVLLPNLQRPGSLPSSIGPIGFGPVAPSWSERAERSGGVAATWSRRELGERPLPEGMDFAAFNAAPRDQQMRALDPAETLVLENLHPEHAQLTTRLPGLLPRASLEGRRSGPVNIAMRPDTLWIDSDRGLCTLTFRGLIPLESADEQGRVTVVTERAPAPEPAAQPRPVEMSAQPPQWAQSGQPAQPARRYEMTADIPLAVRQAGGAALPFTKVASPPRASPSTRPPEPAPASAPVPVAAPPESPWASSSARAEPIHAPPSGFTPRYGAAGASPNAAPGVALGAAGIGGAVPSAIDASNSALGPAPVVLPRAEVPVARPAPRPMPAPRAEPREALELLWFDAESVPRLRRRPAWRAILDEAEGQALDPDFDDPALARDPMLVEDRREVFEILAHAEPLTPAALDEALQRCQRDDGKFVPAVALFTGELELPFDELAALRATLATATPFVGNDEALRGTLDTAREMLAIPDLIAAPAVAEGLTRRIDQAFSQGKRAVPADYLETQRERVLLEQRRYQRRAVFGDKRLRGLLRFDGVDGQAARAPAAKGSAGIAVPVYLPESTAALLPLQARFRARFVAEIRLGADPSEQHAAALVVLALGRASPPIKK